MRKHAGFSLIELITVIAILAILSTISVPNYLRWRSNAQLSRAARDVYSSFQKARLEAVRRNINSAVWFNGNSEYVIYLEPDSVTTAVNGNEEVISTIRWSDYPGVRLDLNEGGGDGLLLSSPNDRIFFAPDGLPRNDSGGLGSATVFLTNNDNSRKITISVSPAGYVQIKKIG